MKRIARLASSTLLVLGAILCILISNSDAAEWTVGKASGVVWVEGTGVQKVSLGLGTRLSGGEQVRTGANGRVLLVRGEETILIAPNSAVALPRSPSSGLETTILQRAGSILLSVEKRNVKHFEVQTPFLAAVVKGTKFTVSVSPDGAEVGVSEGKVEVTDFRSGQVALVLPGQSALVTPNGRPGLSLSGSGKFEAIRQGIPQTPAINVLKLPASGLSAPGSKVLGRSADGRVRINAPIGEVRVDFAKATQGLSRATDALPGTGSRDQEAKRQLATIWSGDNSVIGLVTGSGAGSTGGGSTLVSSVTGTVSGTLGGLVNGSGDTLTLGLGGGTVGIDLGTGLGGGGGCLLGLGGEGSC